MERQIYEGTGIVLHFCVTPNGMTTDRYANALTKKALQVSLVAGGVAAVLYQRHTGGSIVAALLAIGSIADVLAWHMRYPRSPTPAANASPAAPGTAVNTVDRVPIWLRRYGRPIRKVLWDSKTRNAVAAALVAYGWVQVAISLTGRQVCWTAPSWGAQYASRANSTILGVWTIDKENCDSANSLARYFVGVALQALGLCPVGLEILATRSRKANIVAATGAASWAISLVTAAASPFKYVDSVRSGDASAEHTLHLVSAGAMMTAYTVMLVGRVFSCVDEEPSSGSEGRPRA